MLITCIAMTLVASCATRFPSATTTLFDGGSTSQWRKFGHPEFPEFPTAGWVIEDGWLRHIAKGGGGDIITRELFTDFELSFEWRIGVAGNSGVKYLIDEKRGSPVGHEYQLIDDAAHPDALRGPKRQTGALYDALPPMNPPTRPAGKVNRSRIVVQGQHIEHWLNGRRVLTYELDGPSLRRAKAESKFREESRWGTKFPTPILLQDHGDDVWYRRITIRRL